MSHDSSSTTPPLPKTEGCAQVFFPAAAYSDLPSSEWPVRPGVWQRFVCSLDAIDPVFDLPLRIDPMDRRGVVEIAGITLRSGSDGSILWRVRTPNGFQSLRIAGTAWIIPDARVLKILSFGDDPQIYLPLLAGESNGSRTQLEYWQRVDVEPLTTTEWMGEFARQHQELAALRASAERNAQQTSDAQMALAERARELQAARTQLSQKEKQIAWLQMTATDWGRWVSRQRAARVDQVDLISRALATQVERMHRLVGATSQLIQSLIGAEAAQKALPVDRILEGLPTPDAIRWMGDTAAQEKHAAHAMCAALFDAQYYCEKYPDVKSSGLDPLQHYLFFGAMENRWPNPLFDPAYYASRYPDVVESGLIPLQH
jgi:hypothetical protein